MNSRKSVTPLCAILILCSLGQMSSARNPFNPNPATVSFANGTDYLIPSPVNTRWKPAWTEGSQEASLLTLTLTDTIKAGNTASYTIAAGDLSFTNQGAGCDTFTAPELLNVPIKLFQPIHLTVTSTS